MKQRVRRALAALLSLCIIAGTLPAGGFMQQASAAGEYTFDLRGAAYDGSGGNFKNYDGDGWKYYAASNESTVIGISNAFKWTYTQLGPFSSSGDWMAIRLKNLASGKYDVNLSGEVSDGGAMIDCYFIPVCDAAMISGKLTEDALLGTVDFYVQGAWGSNGLAVITPFDLANGANVPTDGDYLLVIRGKDAKNGSGTNRNVFLQTLKMTRTGDADAVEPEEAEKYVFNFVGATWGGSNSNNFIDYGSEAKGWKHYAEQGSMVYTNWKENGTGWDYVQVRPIDSSNNYVAIRLYNLKSGKYDASVSAYVGKNYPAVELFFMPVCDASQIAGKLTADKSLGEVDSNDAEADFEKKTIPVEASINVPEDGNYLIVIKGKDGNPSAALYLNSLEMTRTGDADAVEQPKVEYTYSLRTYKWDGSGEGFTGFDGGNWTLAAKSSTVGLYDNNTWPIAQFKGFAADGDYVAFELKGIERGKYTVSMDAQKSSASVAADFYVIPKCDASKIIANCTSAYFIGNHDNYVNPSESSPSEFTFENSAQAAKDGNYLLVAKRTSGGANRDRLQFTNVKLVKTGDSDLPEPEDPDEPDNPDNPDDPDEPEDPNLPKIEYTYPLRTFTWDGSGNGYQNFDGGNWQLYSRSDSVQLFDAATWPIAQFKGFKADGDYVAFELKNVESGKYTVSMDAQKSSASVAADFYIIPMCDASQILKVCSDEYFIGNHDNYAATSEASPSLFTFPKKAQVTKSGSCLLVVKRTSGGANRDRLQFINVKLKRIGDADLVEDTTPAKSVAITAPETLELGKTGDISFTFELTNGKLVYVLGENDTVEYIVEPSDVASVDASGKITANKVGNATITAKFNFRGAQVVSEAVAFEVTPLKKIKFDFMHRLWELSNLTEITFADTENSWQFYDYSRSVWTDANTAWDKTMSKWGRGLQFKLDKKEKWAAVELNFTSGGSFNAFAIYATYQSGGMNELYLIPSPEEKSEAAVAAALTEENLLGVIDYAGGNPQNAVVGDLVEAFGRVEIPEAGKYLLVSKGTQKHHENSTGYYTYLSGMEFKLVEATLELSASKTELEYNTTAALSHSFKELGGKVITSDEYSISYSSSDKSIATVDANGVITAKGIGEAVITAAAEYKDNTYIAKIPVNCVDTSAPVSAEITAPEAIYVREKINVEFTIALASGNTLSAPSDNIAVEYVANPANLVKVSKDGTVSGVAGGTVDIKALFTVNGKTVESNTVTVEIASAAKQGFSIYTEEERENILYNVENDKTTRSLSKSYAKAADKFVDELDFIYENMIVAEGLPRFYFVGKSDDPNRFTCKYCGCEINKKYTTYGWKMDSFNNPWKIQCPDCKGFFPSNDFGSYYKLGLDERGVFDPELAKERHIEKFGGLHGYGYLKNDLYPDKDPTWGVDDGFGYIYTYENELGGTVTEQHSYIAYYLHFMWYGAYGNTESVQSIIDTLKNAYLYTGDVKYARAGAILLDRIADFFGDFDWYQWRDFRNDASGYRGMILDPIWSCDLARSFPDAYDAFYPVFFDEYVINYLNEKSKKYDMFPKNSAAMICMNIETGILEEVYRHARLGNISGNFGMAQNAVIAAAVAYNNPEKSKEMLDWVMRAGTAKNTGGPQDIKGGNVLPQLVAVVDRDGMGTEASPSYNNGWIGYLVDGAEYLKGFEAYSEVDLYKNPKFLKMFDAHLKVLMGGYYSAQIGDSDAFAGTGKSISAYNSKFAFMATGDPRWAQLMYLLNGNKSDGLRYPDTVKNPSSLASDVQQIINSLGAISLDSSFQSGYGLYTLRDGRAYANSNSTRDFWMYTGANNGHGHQDSLNLGIDAYGLNMGPDLGYPKDTGTEPNRIQWVNSTIAHNTVVVDNKSQTTSSNRGTPFHFDDSGKVKVMDADRNESYEQTDTYRRTVVMVEVDDQVSYGVDFFRIVGGNDHLYSFHSQSNTVSATEGLELIPAADPTNTYAGFKYNTYFAKGPDPHKDSGKVWYANDLTYPAGFTWMDNVTSDATPDKQFSVDFKITDFRNILKDSSGLQLRMTMMNDFDLSEVTVLSGYPVDNYKNPDTDIKYVLARRTGENLDTLFTTVFEPYKNTRYIDSMTAVPVTLANGDAVAADTPVKAVKVIHKSNRIDYIVYSADNSVEYTVDGLFNFKGFVGVVTYADMDKDGVADDSAAPVYTYINDGSVIANTAGVVDAYTGTLESVTDVLTLDNRLVVNINGEISDEAIASMANKVIYVNNDGVQNGGYQIVSAQRIDGSKVELNIGDVSPARAYVDANDIDKGIVCNITAGQTFRIPMSYVTDDAPTMEKNFGEYKASTNARMTFNVTASSSLGKALTYEAVVMPRGAIFNAETGTFIWTPDDAQVGEHSAAIKVSDGTLSETYNAVITVYKGSGGGSSSGGSSGGTSGGTTGGSSGNTGGASGGSSAGGGASGGSSGGGASGGSSSAGSDTGSGSTDTGATETPSTGDTATEHFTDLGNYAWAKDAIYALVEKGVVNGTSESTYAPAANIKRADFAIMLVRAFGITEGEGENFADVDSSKYYAEELRLAKVAGIVNGIGDNKFGPDGEITRQDMMLMLSRALDAQGIELAEADASVLEQFSDAANIADYARDAVSRVVKAGVIAGANGKLNPLDRATRAEVAVMLSRVLAK